MYSKHNTMVKGQKVPPLFTLNDILANTGKAIPTALLHSAFAVRGSFFSCVTSMN